MDVLSAFRAQAIRVEETTRGIGDGDWSAVGLGEWTIAELVAHLIRAADRIVAYVDLPIEGDKPVCDRVAYLDFGLEGEALQQMASGVAERSRRDAAAIGTASLVATFQTAWRQSAELIRDLPATRLIHTIRGPMALEEYAATRVLELVVHHTDLCRALAVDHANDPGAEEMTEAILRGLLAGDPPDDLTGMPFILAATGRTTHPDPRLPVLQ